MAKSEKLDATVLILDDEENILFTLKLLLKQHLAHVYTEHNPFHIPRLLRQLKPDLILLDMNFRKGDTSGSDGIQWLTKIKELHPSTQVVMMTAYADVDIAVHALKTGAVDFIEKPWRNEKLLATIQSALRLSRSEREVQQLQGKQQILSEQLNQLSGEIVGESPAMQAVFKTIEKVATTDVNVLILGENGTGKELVAREIHRQSQRKSEVFINVDLGAIAESLFESELFGHKKGAFTDAHEDRIGRFEAASEGTLFLDEIGNLSTAMQAKLLTALQSREVVRVGTNTPIRTDVRLICATNMPLYDMVKEKSFRQDLLYRINTVEIKIPPLREREGDVALLGQYFLDQYARKYQKTELKFHPATLRKLESHSWQGNVRELRHAIERAVILSDSLLLTPADFLLSKDSDLPEQGVEETLNLEEMEKRLIQRAIQKHRGNISRAAEELGLTRAALYRRLEKFGV